MGIYYHSHLVRLKKEAQQRFDRLMSTLTPDDTVRRLGDSVEVSGYDVRLAVNDFRTILTEIKTLK